jgi:type IV pilus assembly protein PilC
MAIDISTYRNKSRPAAPAVKKAKETGILHKEISLFGRGLSDKKKERFYSELNILFASGVDIKTALELVEEEQSKAKDKLLFGQIKEAVVNGGGLSDAMNKTGKFSPYEFYSIRIGEESGRLTEVLEDLSKFFAGRIKQKRQVMNAVSYPLVVMLTAFGVIWFMLRFVVPMFSDVFKRFKGELPAMTQAVIDASEFLGNNGLYIVLALISLILFLYSQRRKEWFRSRASALLIRLPVFGDIFKKIYLARFCHSMHLLLSARTPLVSALELVQKMVGFYPIEHSLNTVRNDILHGSSLYQSLSKFPIYNSRMRSLIKVAEEVNQSDAIFGKLAKQYTEEVEHRTAMLGSIIEPVMIIFLGLMVAVILIAMYLPLFQLSTSIQ